MNAAVEQNYLFDGWLSETPPYLPNSANVKAGKALEDLTEITRSSLVKISEGEKQKKSDATSLAHQVVHNKTGQDKEAIPSVSPSPVIRQFDIANPRLLHVRNDEEGVPRQAAKRNEYTSRNIETAAQIEGIASALVSYLPVIAKREVADPSMSSASSPVGVAQATSKRLEEAIKKYKQAMQSVPEWTQSEEVRKAYDTQVANYAARTEKVLVQNIEALKYIKVNINLVTDLEIASTPPRAVR